MMAASTPRQLVPAPGPAPTTADRRRSQRRPPVKRGAAKLVGGASRRAAASAAAVATPAEGPRPHSGRTTSRHGGSPSAERRDAAMAAPADAIVRPIADGPRVWIDDPDPFFRLGVDQFLRRNGVEVIGHSEGFRPRPDLSRTMTILLFHLTENWRELAAGIAEDTPAHL